MQDDQEQNCCREREMVMDVLYVYWSESADIILNILAVEWSIIIKFYRGYHHKKLRGWIADELIKMYCLINMTFRDIFFLLFLLLIRCLWQSPLLKVLLLFTTLVFDGLPLQVFLLPIDDHHCSRRRFFKPLHNPFTQQTELRSLFWGPPSAEAEGGNSLTCAQVVC